MKKSPSVKEFFSDSAADWVNYSYFGKGRIYPTARHRSDVVCNILKTLQPGTFITDLGCGAGQLAQRMAEIGHTVSAFDQSEKMIQLANEQKASLPTEIADRISFSVADIDNVPADLPPQDAVTCMGVLGYLETDAQLFKPAVEALKPGGLFLVSTRNRLFNVVSFSHRTISEIDGGNAGRLVDEITRLSTPITREQVKHIAENLILSGQAILESLKSPESPEPADAAPVGTTAIEARQHTPMEIVEQGRRHGLEMVSLHGVHPHLMQPHLNQLMPANTYNILSSVLEPLHDHPASLAWSSVIVAVFKKPA